MNAPIFFMLLGVFLDDPPHQATGIKYIDVSLGVEIIATDLWRYDEFITVIHT